LGKGKSNGRACVYPQWLIDELVVELAADRLYAERKESERRAEKSAVVAEPVKPMMTFWVNDPRFEGVFPVLKNKKN